MTSKGKKFVLFPIATIAVAGLMFSCTNLSELSLRPQVEVDRVGGFEVSGLSIYPTEVAARDSVIVSAEIKNVTTADNTYNAELKINDVTESAYNLLVPAGKTETVIFMASKDVPGKYQVALGQLTGQFDVVQSIAGVPGSSVPALSGQARAGCCAVGNPSASPTPGQTTGAGCCGAGAQNGSTPIPGSTGGGCCGR